MLTRCASSDPVAMDRLRLLVAAGIPPEDTTRLPERCRRAIGVAMAVGAPLLEAIDGAQAAEDDVARVRRAVAVASAQTKAVAGGLLLAPVVLVPALGRLVGADLFGFYTSRPGVLVLAAGATLLLVGGLLVVALVRRVGRSSAPTAPGTRRALLVALAIGAVTWRLAGPVAAPLAAVVASHLAGRWPKEVSPCGIDEAADLAATALAGGVSAAEALRVAAEQLPALAHRLNRLAFGLELGMAADDLAPMVTPRRGPIDAAVATLTRRADRRSTTGCAPAPGHPPPGGAAACRSRRTAAVDGTQRLVAAVSSAVEAGAPIAPTLRRLARDLRADDLARILAAAERLPAQLTFPTALCLLPGTVLLVGAPIVHAGLVAAGA